MVRLVSRRYIAYGSKSVNCSDQVLLALVVCLPNLTQNDPRGLSGSSKVALPRPPASISGGNPVSPPQQERVSQFLDVREHQLGLGAHGGGNCPRAPDEGRPAAGG